MTIRKAALRSMVAGAFLWSALGAPGLARAAVPTQTADLQLTGGFTPVVTDATTTPPTKGPPTKITFGKTIKYTFTLSNLGPGHATGVQLDAPTALPAGTTVTAVTGATCATDPTSGDLVFPCPISADLLPADPAITDKTLDPGVVTLTLTLTLDVPKTASASICAGTTPLGDLTVSVSTDANTTDPTAANNVVTTSGATVLRQPYTDLGIAIDGPTSGTVGQSITQTGTVTNSGPCDAQKVVVSFVPGNLLTFESGTGACTTTDDCKLGTVAAGTAVTFSTTYKIAPLPSGVIQTTIPNELDVATSTSPNVNADDGVATTGIRVGKEAGGCNSGGPGGLVAVALMAAAVFAARRRRTA